jgi:hypothetical protein
MVTVDELIVYALTKVGQVFLEAIDLDYNVPLVERDVFIPTLGEYQRYRPIVKYMRGQVVPNSGYLLPDNTIGVTGVRFTNYLATTPQLTTIAAAGRMPIRRDQWYMSIDDNTGEKKLKIVAGNYDFEILLPYTTTKEIPIEFPSIMSTGVSFKLPSVPRTQLSFTVPDGYVLASIPDTEDYLVTSIEGLDVLKWVPSSNELVSLAPSFDFSDFDMSYESRSLAVKELTMMDDRWTDLFAIRFLLAWSSTKAIMKLPDLPVGITEDQILEYSRTRESEYRTLVSTDQQKWWIF